MFKIYDGRDSFYQWDLNRKLIVYDNTISEVHFSNRMSDNALVCEVYTDNGLTLVNVPNILLQQSYAVNVYAYDGEFTRHSISFEVKPRTKPTDYVYTETEVKNWEEIKADVEQLYKNFDNAVNEVNGQLETINETVKNVNGIKYITETVEAKDLEYGIYFIDEANGGCVTFDSLAVTNVTWTNEFFNGIVFVSSYWGDKRFTVFELDSGFVLPIIFETVYSFGLEKYTEDLTFQYANKNYVDEQIASLQAQIDKLK